VRVRGFGPHRGISREIREGNCEYGGFRICHWVAHGGIKVHSRRNVLRIETAIRERHSHLCTPYVAASSYIASTFSSGRTGESEGMAEAAQLGLYPGGQ
jgi:hypothetical protein